MPSNNVFSFHMLHLEACSSGDGSYDGLVNTDVNEFIECSRTRFDVVDEESGENGDTEQQDLADWNADEWRGHVV